MIYKKALISYALTIAFFTSSASATLVHNDYISTGDALIVTDTINGYDWVSFNAANQTNDLSSLLNTYQGYQLATQTQLKTLWDHYLTAWTWDVDATSFQNTERMDQAIAFQNVFGWGPQGSDRTTYFTVSDNNNQAEMNGFRVNEPLTAQSYTQMFYSNSYTRPYYNDDDIAYALVSISGNHILGNIATVPEPATLALMGLGLAGMAARHRKYLQA